MDESVIDKAVYAELQDTAGAEFAAELVDTFLEEASGMLAELRSARAENHAERFRRAAHSLKSNSNTFGAVEAGRAGARTGTQGPGCRPGARHGRTGGARGGVRACRRRIEGPAPWLTRLHVC